MRLEFVERHLSTFRLECFDLVNVGGDTTFRVGVSQASLVAFCLTALAEFEQLLHASTLDLAQIELATGLHELGIGFINLAIDRFDV